MDISGDKSARARLERECERAKITLSTELQTSIRVENIHADQHLIVDITRDQFEELAEAPVFSKLLEPVDRALEDCETEAAEIDTVLLVGGSTRIPYVQ